MNQNLLEIFISGVKGKNVLEIGFKGSVAELLKKMSVVHSFDIKTSPLKYNSNARFRQNELVKLPYDDNMFGGVAACRMLGYGDASFLFDEVMRVTDGPAFFVEDSIDSFPLDYFITRDDMMLDYASKNGELVDANMTFTEFFSRRDIIKLFSSPGGMLNKFNLLVPEDIKTDVGILCKKIKRSDAYG